MTAELKITSQQHNAKMAEQLKSLRMKNRFTMRALAERLNTPHSFIGKTEQLNRRLDVGEFIQYCIALEEDPAKVFKQLVSDVT